MADYRELRAKVAADLLQNRDRIRAQYSEILRTTQVHGTIVEGTFKDFGDFLEFSLNDRGDSPLRDRIGLRFPVAALRPETIDATFFQRLGIA